MPGRPAPLADRFWAKVDRSGGPNACWPWRGATCRASHGRSVYGHLRDGPRGSSPVKAHRVALLLTDGPPPPDKPEACHAITCTTALCCNGAHLRWGTRQDNCNDIGARRDYRTLTEMLTATLDTLAAEGLL